MTGRTNSDEGSALAGKHVWLGAAEGYDPGRKACIMSRQRKGEFQRTGVRTGVLLLIVIFVTLMAARPATAAIKASRARASSKPHLGYRVSVTPVAGRLPARTRRV